MSAKLTGLRRANIDASAGVVVEIERLVAQIRARWPDIRIVVLADSGFARETLMAWAEQHQVDYVLGLARNSRLVGEIGAELAAATAMAERTGQSARCFKDFRYQTLDSWSSWSTAAARSARIRASSSPRSRPRLGQQQRSTHSSTAPAARSRTASRSASSTSRANGAAPSLQGSMSTDIDGERTVPPPGRCAPTVDSDAVDRLWFASMAYVLLAALRRIALPATRLAQATAGTIRLRLLKIGALVGVSVRRVAVQMASGHPWQRDWAIAYQALSTAAD